MIEVLWWLAATAAAGTGSTGFPPGSNKSGILATAALIFAGRTLYVAFGVL